MLALSGLGLFVLGVIAATTNTALGVIPVTPYEADINKDGRINSLDQLGLAKNYGKPVPTATNAPPPPVSIWRTYTVGSTVPDFAHDLWCDWGDRLLTTSGDPRWGPDSGPIAIRRSEADPSSGIQREGATISNPGAYNSSITCFDDLPIR
jgi:hypothetical protein